MGVEETSIAESANDVDGRGRAGLARSPSKFTVAAEKSWQCSAVLRRESPSRPHSVRDDSDEEAMTKKRPNTRRADEGGREGRAMWCLPDFLETADSLTGGYGRGRQVKQGPAEQNARGRVNSPDDPKKHALRRSL